MTVTGNRLALFAFLVLVAGCGDPSNPGQPPPDVYPVRSDWLVVSAPKTQPSRLDEPGYPPLLLLSRARETYSADTLALYKEVEGNAILDTGKLPPDQRRRLGGVLTGHFGTPTGPKVGFPSEGGLERLDRLIAILEKGEPTEEQAKELYAHAQDPILLEDLPILLDEAVQDDKEGILERAKAFRQRLQSERALLEQVRETLRLDEPTLARGGAVYRKYCLDCHGLTGDGDGPGGRWMVPHPRDYRRGVFKFVSSEPTVAIGKPRREDLRQTIVHGMDGAGMPSFAVLPEEDIDAAISYVTHLSLRGECEYEAIKLALDRRFGLPDLGEVEGVVWGSSVEKVVHENLAAIAPRWMAADQNPVEPDPDPYDTPDRRLAAAADGFRLFNDAKVGTCTTCHINYGRTPFLTFDIWGTIVRPRDLTTGTLRGGRAPEDIYRRIYVGIAGSGMPSFRDTLKPTSEQLAKGEHPLWQLVHFLKVLPDPEQRRLLREKYEIELE